MSLREELRACTVEELLHELQVIGNDRPGFLFDVGQGILRLDPIKVVPQEDWQRDIPKVVLTAYDHERVVDAYKAFYDLQGFYPPIDDPRWLKATRAERRAAARAAPEHATRIEGILQSLDRGKRVQVPSFFLTWEEVDPLVARWASYGFTVEVIGSRDPVLVQVSLASTLTPQG